MSDGRGGRGGIVYSTEHGRMCPRCGRPAGGCSCRVASEGTSPVTGGRVTIRRETGGRRGKEVTLISGLPLSGMQLDDLCRDLKRQCGSGGTVKNGAIEIQGHHRDRLASALEQKGWKVKKR